MKIFFGSLLGLGALLLTAYGIGTNLQSKDQITVFVIGCSILSAFLIIFLCKTRNKSWFAALLTQMIVGGVILVGTIAYVGIGYRLGQPQDDLPLWQKTTGGIALISGGVFAIGFAWLMLWVLYSMATAKEDSTQEEDTV